MATMKKTSESVQAIESGSNDAMQLFIELCGQPAIKAMLTRTIDTKAAEIAAKSSPPTKPAGFEAKPPGTSAKSGKPYPAKLGVRIEAGRWQHWISADLVRFILANAAAAEAACKQVDKMNAE